MSTAVFHFRQLRAELTALVSVTAQTAWTAASQLVVLPAGNGEARGTALELRVPTSPCSASRNGGYTAIGAWFRSG